LRVRIGSAAPQDFQTEYHRAPFGDRKIIEFVRNNTLGAFPACFMGCLSVFCPLLRCFCDCHPCSGSVLRSNRELPFPILIFLIPLVFYLRTDMPLPVYSIASSTLEFLDPRSRGSSIFESGMIVCHGVRDQPDFALFS
jgi:hypothetical protein